MDFNVVVWSIHKHRGLITRLHPCDHCPWHWKQYVLKLFRWTLVGLSLSVRLYIYVNFSRNFNISDSWLMLLLILAQQAFRIILSQLVLKRSKRLLVAPHRGTTLEITRPVVINGWPTKFPEWMVRSREVQNCRVESSVESRQSSWYFLCPC